MPSGPETPGSTPSATTVVVGIDPSDGAASALRWALGEAHRHGARVVAVHAWDWPYTGALGTLAADALGRLEFEEAARRVVSAMVAGARGDDFPDVAVEERVVEGGPADVLLRAAEDADLLVVGSRGRGGFTRLLLGSVSQHCLSYAPCPVVVVPPADRPSVPAEGTFDPGRTPPAGGRLPQEPTFRPGPPDESERAR